MWIRRLYLKNFRNYAEAEIDFSPLVNVIIGENAQGKTNLLEAALLVSTGRSFKTAHLKELIFSQEGRPLGSQTEETAPPFFHIEAITETGKVPHRVQLSYYDGLKKLEIDSNRYGNFHPLLGMLPSVYLLPEDLELVSGAPQVRRHFLNFHLAQSDPLYVHHLARFWRAMKERNCLLRAKKGDAIACYESEMAQSAVYLFHKRSAFEKELKEPFKNYGEKLSFGTESYEMKYLPSFPPSYEDYLKQLAKNREKEKEIGSTLTGPHRDDVSFSLKKKQVRTFASIGQKMTLVAALRLAEWDRLYAKFGEKPFFAIDDFGLPLDPKRQNAFLESLADLGQVWITTSNLTEGLKNRSLIEVSQGAFTKVFSS